MTRSSLLSVLLIVAIALVLTKTYWLWTTGPWELPNPGKAKAPILAESVRPASSPVTVIGTETIVGKNIFDPERGAGFTREAEASSQAFQRIRAMVLLGTAILGNNRFAILQDGSTGRAAQVPGPSAAPMRVKLGDTVEGFKLSEVSEKRVVFAKGPSTVEIPLDYFRKIEIAQPQKPSATQPTAATQAPRTVAPAQPNIPRQRVPRPIPALPRRDPNAAAEEREGR